MKRRAFCLPLLLGGLTTGPGRLRRSTAGCGGTRGRAAAVGAAAVAR